MTRRVVFVQPSLQPPGGGNGVAAWMLQALASEYEVVACTIDPVDFVAVDAFFGTSLAHSGVAARRLPTWLRLPLDAIPSPASRLKANVLTRWAAGLGEAVIVSAFNEADFGRRGVQYVHYPWNLYPRPENDLRWYHRPAFVLSSYRALCNGVAGFTDAGAARNLTLANSDWTGAIYRRRYGADFTTVYPPVAGAFADVPWEAREDGFLCIGRISPEKEIHTIVEILGAVRARGRDVHLHIVGTADNPDYYERVVALARENAGWVRLDENLSRDALARLIETHRFGIHGMREEHFGMAVAEMMSGGCVVFVPDGGGQVEIVGRDERLLYRSVDEGVAKIEALMDDAGALASVRDGLAARRHLFTAERFMREVLAAVAAV